MLSGDNPFIFQGTLKKMRIVSNNICYGPMPEPDEEVENGTKKPEVRTSKLTSRLQTNCFDYEGNDLSDLVRDTVGMDDLYVFDGNYRVKIIMSTS